MGLKPGGSPSEPLRPRLREIDVDRGTIVREIAHEVDPAHAPSPRSHQEFTAATFLADGLLLQPAHTELLWIDPRRARIERVVSDPRFHGVHSAAADPGGGVVVTCAGTDTVLGLDRSGAVDRAWNLAPRTLPRGDLRRVDHDALKPHAIHPNFASYVDETLWVTCFEPHDARAIDGPGPGRRIALPESFPHDGRLRAGWLWFTQVAGRVIAVDPVTLERRLTVDLRARCTDGTFGWCRGVEVVGSRLFVGVTMLRDTRHREVLRELILGPPGRRLPTRVIEFDLDRMRIVREIPVGNGAGGTIYSVLAPPDRAG
ncbi:MAG: hypothetical protein ABMB14_08685 [Myxococcota bacterium]